MRTLQDLNLCDDFLFHEVMMDEEIVKKFLETVLDIKIRKIVYIESEKTLSGGYQWKSIRLDVYVEDDANTVYNIEMQNGIWSSLPKRSRKYSAQMDARLLKAGEDYDRLKRQIVIFICTFDPFGEGFCRYTFSNRCHELPKLELGDETAKIFLNTKGTKGEISDGLKAFLQFVEKSTPENAAALNDEFINEISGKITKLKEDEQIGGTFMTFEEKLQEIAKQSKAEGEKIGKQEGEKLGRIEGEKLGKEAGRKEGREQGAREASLAAAAKMLKAGGFTAEQIAEFLSLTVAEVEELKKTL